MDTRGSRSLWILIGLSLLLSTGGVTFRSPADEVPAALATTPATDEASGVCPVAGDVPRQRSYTLSVDEAHARAMLINTRGYNYGEIGLYLQRPLPSSPLSEPPAKAAPKQ